MKRRWQFLRQQLRRENWPALGYILAIFALLVLGVSSAVSGLEVRLLWFPVFLAVVLGWGLASSSIPVGLAVILCLLIGPTLIIVQTGNLMTSMGKVVASLIQFIKEAIQLQAAPSVTPLIRGWDEFARATTVVVTRLYDWSSALIQGEPSFDPVATSVLWLLVLWGAAFWAGWIMRRRNRPMLALLPPLIMLAIMLAASNGPALVLAPALALTLLLKATTAQAVKEDKWKADGIDFSPRTGGNRAWTVLALVLVLMIISLITPSPSIYRLLDYARNFAQQERDQALARALGGEAAPGSAESDAFSYERVGGLPARHLIGSGPELSQQLVMVITFEGPSGPVNGLRYWRGVTYDRYTGRGWESGDTTTITYAAGEVAGGLAENQRPVRQEVRLLDDLGGLIYTAGSLTTVDEPFQVAWRARFLDTNTYTDFFAAVVADVESNIYLADSLVPEVDEVTLRSAGRDTPAWIRDHYLALPEGISDRVRALARDLTATEPTTYDRALAIERYLRQIPYTLDLPAPPVDHEIADYFLFEIQRGYCDYYATTMVVLARAAGLPARMVTGYAGGAYDEARDGYTVTADLAHSWPEIYFPEHGWIPFEPTAERAAIDRLVENHPQSELEPETELEPITAARNRARWNLALRIAAGLDLAAVALAFGWWLFDVFRLRLLSPYRAILRIFEQLKRSGWHLDLQTEPGATPHEFASQLNKHMAELSRGWQGRILFASAPEAIDWLTGLYNCSRYSPYEPKAIQHRRAIRTWSILRLQLFWAALWLRYKKMIGRIRPVQ